MKLPLRFIRHNDHDYTVIDANNNTLIAHSEHHTSTPDISHAMEMVRLMNSCDQHIIDILANLIAHIESINHAFYVDGTKRAMLAAFKDQKKLLTQARATMELVKK